MKLQLKILVPIIILIVALLAASSIVTYNISSQSLKNSILAHMESSADDMRRTINTNMSDAVKDMLRTATSETVTQFFSGDIYDKASSEHMNAILVNVTDSYAKFFCIAILDEHGFIVASSNDKTIGADFRWSSYYKESIQGKTHISDPYPSPINGEGVIVASAPVMRDGKAVGVVYGLTALKNLYDRAVVHVKVGEHGYGYVVDKNGRIVVASPAQEKWLFKDDVPTAAIFKNLLNQPQGLNTITDNEGRTVEVYHIVDRELGLMTIVQAESDDVFSSLTSLRNMGILVALVAVIFGCITVWLLVRPIVRVLDKGVVFAKEIASGNLHSSLDVRRNDEIGQLADALRTIPAAFTNIASEYDALEQRIESGELDALGDEAKFSGDFAKLVQGTNGILKRFRTIIDNIPSPVVVLNKDLFATYLNRVATQVAGQDYKGKTCFELMAREDFNGPDCALKKAVDTKQMASHETVAHPQGKSMDISYTAIPMLDSNGQIASVMQLVTDLTAIKSTQRTIVEVATQAMDIANRVATASGQLSAQAAQINSGTDIQRERASSTATAMEEMNSTVLEVARNAALASQQAGETQSKADEGASIVREVVSAIEEVNSVAHQLEANMQELGTQAENIGNVMNVISDIADQTNLLALNAAIEAARAGEAGRGFAVVADEVRKLAEKTMQATSQVGSSISGIQDATAKNIERVAEAARGVEHSTSLAATSGDALGEILRLANGNADLISGIATAAEEQSATSEEINRAIDEISRIANETAQGMNDSANAVNELANMAQELRGLLERLNK